MDEYLSGTISREQFEDWFYPTVLDLDVHDWPNDANLIWATKLRLAEFSNGHLSEDELRNALSEITKQYEQAHATMDRTAVGALTVTESLLSVDTPT